MHPFWHGILDLLYPPRCQVCRCFNPQPFCTACLESIELIQPPMCRRCGTPFDPQATGPDECSDCRRDVSSPIAWSRSAGLYDGSLRKAILALKFLGRRSLAPALADLLASALPHDATIDVVCPVPLHLHRLSERGFNQSELLAQYFCEQASLPHDPHFLYRARPTIPQVALPRQERGRNVRGAFALSDGKLAKDLHVLLIDDIHTTGSTLRECARILRKAGAAEVYVLTVARPRPAWMARGEA
jgi:ComF family protein